MEKIQIKSIIIFLTCLLLLTNCSTIIKTPKYKSPDIDLEKTFILGKGDNWMGRLSLINKKNIEEIYSFFLNEMIKFSYKEKASIRSDVSTLIFENNKKAIFIKISKLNFGKTYIEITATPVN